MAIPFLSPISASANIRLANSGKLFLWNDHDSNYLMYDRWRASASAGMNIQNVSGTGSIFLRSGNALALTLDASQNVIAADAFTGKLQGAVTGAPDSTIWRVSGQYTNWGIFYNEGSPDKIEFKAGGTVTSTIALDNGDATFNNVHSSGRVRVQGGTDNGSQLNLFCDSDGDAHLAAYTFTINTGSNSSRTESLKIDNNKHATFAGNVTTTGVAYTDYIQTRSGTSIDFRHQDASVIMRIDTDDARVGIGTTSPYYKLDTRFANTDTSFSGGGSGNWGSNGIRVENTVNTVNSMSALHLRNGDADIHIAGIRKGTNDSDLGFFWEGAQKVLFENDGAATFTGAVSGTEGNFSNSVEAGALLKFGTNGNADIVNIGTGAIRFKPSSQTLALTLAGANATFAGDIVLPNNKNIKFENSVGNVVGVMNFNASNELVIYNGNSPSGDILFKDGGPTGTTNLTIDGATGNSTFAGDVYADGGDIYARATAANTNSMLRATSSGSGGIAGLGIDASNGDFAGSDYFTLRQLDNKQIEFNARTNTGNTLFYSKGSLNLTQNGADSTFEGLVQVNRDSADIPASGGANLYLVDTRSLAANTGGAIVFSSYYQGTAAVSGGSYIKGYKENATSGDYGYGLKFGVRENGQGLGGPCLTLSSTGNATFTGTVTTGGDLTIGGTGGIFIPEYIYHSGNTNTYLGFPTDEEWKLVAGGTNKFAADANAAYMYYQGNTKLGTTSTGVTITGTMTATNDVSGAGDLSIRNVKLNQGNSPTITLGVINSSTGNSKIQFYSKNSGAANGYALQYNKDTNIDRLEFIDGSGNANIKFINGGAAEFAGSVTASTINTGQGATEVHLMNQNLRTTDDVTFDNLIVTGNITVTGDLNTVSVTDLDVSDKTITVGVGQDEGHSGGSGLKVSGPSTQPSMLWNESNDTWDFNYGIDVDGNIDVGTQATDILIGDNLSAALQIKESSNVYMRFNTTNGGEKIEINKPVEATFINASTGFRMASGQAIDFVSTNIGYNSIERNTSVGGLQINTGDTASMNILDNGNVGIGTNAPTAPLDVVGVRAGRNWAINNRANIRLDSNGTAAPADILFGHTAAANQTSWTGVYWALSSRGTADGNKFHFYRGGGNPGGNEAIAMTIASDLRVGIGTSSPNSELHVQSEGADIRLQSTATDAASRYILQTDDREWRIGTHGGQSDNLWFYDGTAGAYRMVISTAGNVGIGTTTPDSFNSNARNLVVNSSGNTGISITTTDTSANSSLIFADGTGGTAGYRGAIRYKHDGDYMQFDTSASEKMRINSSGTLLINKTFPASTGAKFSINGMAEFETSLTENDDWQNSPISIGERGNVGSTQTANKYAPNLNFHWGGVTSKSLWMGADGHLSFGEYQSDGTPTANGTFLVSTIGIGTTSPDHKLNVVGVNDSTAVGIDIGSNAKFDFAANSTSAYTTTFNMDDTGLDIGHDSTSRALNLKTGDSDRLTILGNGNVGIGATSPLSKLHIDSSEAAMHFTRHGQETYRVIHGSSGLYFSKPNSGGLAFGVTQNSDFDTFDSSGNTLFRSDASTGRAGIGTTSPAYKLSVNGGISGAGFVTYTKAYGSLNSTGNAVAGITASANGNGSSCGFTFTCFGGAGKYQKVVYSCYNDQGTWRARKVIDEGTNDLDVAASADGSTITFTFRATSSNQSYTPRVKVEAEGHNINSTYA